ncbi:NAD(P)/FAD-dependent oxidoreductase [Patescibacteria group bacterium]|nr:NAD(P)/FAD-dependent oxidoreductase [Patescibacteria group bacterium]MBU4481679.1 NAD(P)/FAD-dependent oxidoreductase [Patescibacteria group bacterium]
MKYDAIIAGASFAGLGVAKVLKGNVLLIDRKFEIGDGQTSACCSYEYFLAKLGYEEAILQVIDVEVFHCGSEDIVSHLNYPLATIDYKKFCQLLFKNSRAQFLSAKILGLKGNKVVTDKGEFQSDCIVDASGWQAVLASLIRNDFVPKNGKSFGIETTPIYKNEALEIWVNPKMMPKGVFWIFPCGDFSRLGIASYLGKTNIKEGLESFVKSFGLKITEELHGGFFPSKFREPTAGNIFLVGDSAGQCLPLTGEGIRPAIYFGKKCGEIIQQIINKEKTLEQGLKDYRDFAMSHKKYYTFLLALQKILTNVPNYLVASFTKFVNLKPVFKYCEKKYIDLADLK